MTYYKDEIEKLKYLRNQIAFSLSSSGTFPDRSIIDKRLEAIDSKLALFHHLTVKESAVFDVKQFNSEFMNLYQDLKILYELVYFFKSRALEETRSYVEMHLAELETLAERYAQKSRFETGNTALGKTVYFKGSGITPSVKNHIATIDCGDVKVSKGARVSFFIKGRYFNQEDVVFKLGPSICSPYDVNMDTITINGTSSYKTYNCKMPEDATHNSMYILNSDSFTPVMKNKYVIYGGQDTIAVSKDGTDTFVKKDKGAPVTLTGKGHISFYVIGGSYISFDFSKAPENANFSGYMMQNIKEHQKVSFEYTDGISFEYITDGAIYAVKKNGIINGTSLYYPDADDLSTFRIEEYAGNDTVNMNLKITVTQSGEHVPAISMIAVKETAEATEDD